MVYFQGAFKVKTGNYLLFLLCWIYTDGSKTVVVKTGGALAQIRTVAPDCISSHCIFSSTHSQEKKKKKKAS